MSIETKLQTLFKILSIVDKVIDCVLKFIGEKVEQS